MTGRGGARPGAGRPKKIETQIAEAKQTLTELHETVRGGFGQIADVLPVLIHEEIKTALGYDPQDPDVDAKSTSKERMEARHFLLNKILPMLGSDDNGDKDEPAIASVVRRAIDSQGRVEIEESHVEPDSSRHDRTIKFNPGRADSGES